MGAPPLQKGGHCKRRLSDLELGVVRDRVARERLAHPEQFDLPEDLALRNTAPKKSGVYVPWPPPWPLDLLAEPSEERLP